MDSALRDALREEKKRQKSRKEVHRGEGHRTESHKPRHKNASETPKNRSSSSHHGHPSRDRSKKRSHRRHKSENDSKSVEFVSPSVVYPESSLPESSLPESSLPEIGNNVLMFLFEDSQGKLYKNLNALPIPSDSETTAKIFPVYVHGSHDNFMEEEIVYKDGEWTSSLESSWLEWMKNPEYQLLEYPGEEVVVYNQKFFYSENDMLQYLEYAGPEVLTVEP